MSSAKPVVQLARPYRWENLILASHSWIIFLFLYAPIVILVIFSFNASRQTAIWGGFTLDWYAKLVHNQIILKAVKNSLFVAGLTTVVATFLGTLAALALDRWSFKGIGFTRLGLFLPIIIPEIVVGAATVTFFGVIQMRLSIWTVVIAHIAFSISYVAIVVRARLSGFDRTLEEAAMDLGAGPLATFFHITLPLILPGILAGALLVFTISIDDFVITSFVAGVGATTLPLQIYSMVKVGVTPEVNAVSTLLLVVTVIMIAVAQRLQQEPTPPGEPR